MEKQPIPLGTKALFIQHYAIVRDLDSCMEHACAVSFRDGIEDVEEKVEKYCEARSMLTMNGNTLEAEYQGTTGRTTIQERIDHKGRHIWIIYEVLTESEVDLESFTRL